MAAAYCYSKILLRVCLLRYPSRQPGPSLKLAAADYIKDNCIAQLNIVYEL